jgi:antiviral helicase SKI2
MAKRGIAIHHSGVLPILRESVELLFQTGRIKVLFATETFASMCHCLTTVSILLMIVFQWGLICQRELFFSIHYKNTMDEAFVSSYQVRKYMKICQRLSICLGEYIQMAGRAGRRGLDKTGTVIALCKGDVPSVPLLKAMIQVNPWH